MALEVEADRPLWRAVVLSGAMDPVRSPDMRQSEEVTVSLLREIFAEGQKRGEITREFPVVHLAEFMEGLYNTIVRRWAVDLTGPHKLTERVRSAVEFFCAAWSRDRPRPVTAILSHEVARMKAAVLHEFKRPLTIQEVDRPKPEDNEVLIAVEACGVCHSDLHVADGDWPQLARIVKKPLILGHEIAGRVVEKGAAVRDLQVGDRVGVAWLHWSCGDCEFCREGNENLCMRQKITGRHR